MASGSLSRLLEKGEPCCSVRNRKTLKCSHSWIERKLGVYSRASRRHTPVVTTQRWANARARLLAPQRESFPGGQILR